MWQFKYVAEYAKDLLQLLQDYQIVVDRHRGILKCRSQPGEETEFWIQIPVNCSLENISDSQSPIIANSNKAIASQPCTTESPPTANADGFIPSTTPSLQPTDLLIRHIQFIHLNYQIG